MSPARWRRFAAVAATVAVCFAAGWVASDALTAPDCPTEDSCTAVYHDGAWHITEVTP